MTDLLVYTTFSRAALVRSLLARGCADLGATVRLEQYSSGSLYQRLGSRRGPPLPDVVVWSGPFAAAAAAADGLLQAYQPRRVADGAPHDQGWRWTTLDFSVVGTSGSPPPLTIDDVAGAPKIAMADPERVETGLTAVLAVLDRARQVQGDLENGWHWWAARAARGLAVTSDDTMAMSEVGQHGTTLALVVSESAMPVIGLAPIPHALAITATTRNLDAARALVDWLASERAAPHVRLSPWTIGNGPLADVVSAAPALDVEWARQSYSPSRQRWGQSAFTPPVTAT